MKKVIFLLMVVLLVAGCTQPATEKVIKEVKNMKISSPAFEHKADIPSKYTCDGQDINPSLNIGNVPENAKSLVLIVDDPDAPVGVWDHWIVWNIPADVGKIGEDSVPQNAVQGTNDFKKQAYGGPCPPAGAAHRYRFKLYTLDTMLDLEPGSSKKDVESAMEGHIVGQAEIVGMYGR